VDTDMLAQHRVVIVVYDDVVLRPPSHSEETRRLVR
jgi:hypothetical protein